MSSTPTNKEIRAYSAKHGVSYKNARKALLKINGISETYKPDIVDKAKEIASDTYEAGADLVGVKTEKVKNAEKRREKREELKQEAQDIKSDTGSKTQQFLIENMEFLQKYYEWTFTSFWDSTFMNKITNKKGKSYRKLTDNLIQLKAISSNDNFLEEITKKNKKEYLINEIKNHEITGLVPLVNFYKCDKTNPENRVLMHFETHTNLTDLELMTTDQKSRGGGIGLSHFEIQNNGKNPAEVLVHLKADLRLELTSMQDLYKIRNKKVFSDGSSIEYTALDFIKPDLRRNHFIKAELGWNLINSNEFTSKELRESVKNSRYTVDLDYLTHDLKHEINGKISINVNYVARVERVLSKNNYSIVEIATLLGNINDLTKTSQQKKEEAESRETLAKSIKSYKKKIEALQKIRIKVLKNKKLSSLVIEQMPELNKKFEILKKEIRLTLSKNLYYQSLKSENGEDLSIFKLISNNEGIKVETIGMKTEIRNSERTGKELKKDENKKDEIVKDITLGADRGEQFTFLGIIFKNLFDFVKLSNYIKTSGGEKGLTNEQLFYKEKNVLLKELKNTKIVLGNVTFSEQNYEISQIPVSITAFAYFIRRYFFESSNGQDVSIKNFALMLIREFIKKPIEKYYKSEKIKLTPLFTITNKTGITSKDKFFKEKDSVIYITVSEAHSFINLKKELSYEERLKEGIYTIYSHKQEGGVKKYNLSPISNPAHFKESMFMEKFERFNVPETYYKLNIDMIGGNLFLPGQKVYLDNLHFWQNNVVNIQKNELEKILRVNGYYVITHVKTTFSGDSGSLKNSLQCLWFGDNNVIRQNALEKKEEKEDTMLLLERKEIGKLLRSYDKMKQTKQNLKEAEKNKSYLDKLGFGNYKELKEQYDKALQSYYEKSIDKNVLLDDKKAEKLKVLYEMKISKQEINTLNKQINNAQKNRKYYIDKLSKETSDDNKKTYKEMIDKYNKEIIKQNDIKKEKIKEYNNNVDKYNEL